MQGASEGSRSPGKSFSEKRHFHQETSSGSLPGSSGCVLKGVWGSEAFPDSSVGKEYACSAGDPGSIPGLGRCPGEGNSYPLQYSGLENCIDRIVHGVIKGWKRLSHFHFWGSEVWKQDRMALMTQSVFCGTAGHSLEAC